jgi:hypothetical protein
MFLFLVSIGFILTETQYIGMPFDVRDAGMPLGALPSSATMYLELHGPDDASSPTATTAATATESSSGFFVRTFIWVPCSPLDKKHSKPGIDCNYRPVKLHECDLDCPLTEFERIVQEPAQKYGTWVTHPFFMLSS